MCQAPRTLPALGRHFLKVVPAFFYIISLLFIINTLSGLRIPMAHWEGTCSGAVIPLVLRQTGAPRPHEEGQPRSPNVSELDLGASSRQQQQQQQQQPNGRERPIKSQGILSFIGCGSARILYTGRTSETNHSSVYNPPPSLLLPPLSQCSSIPSESGLYLSPAIHSELLPWSLICFCIPNTWLTRRTEGFF